MLHNALVIPTCIYVQNNERKNMYGKKTHLICITARLMNISINLFYHKAR